MYKQLQSNLRIGAELTIDSRRYTIVSRCYTNKNHYHMRRIM